MPNQAIPNQGSTDKPSTLDEFQTSKTGEDKPLDRAAEQAARCAQACSAFCISFASLGCALIKYEHGHH